MGPRSDQRHIYSVRITPTVLLQNHLDWERDSGNQNPRVYQTRTTDVPAGLTKATVLSYTTSDNNVSVVSERDFSTDGSFQRLSCVKR
jgi:hypothetical protein